MIEVKKYYKGKNIVKKKDQKSGREKSKNPFESLHVCTAFSSSSPPLR
jgi:hypothetical protein